MDILGKTESQAYISDGNNVFTTNLPITKDHNETPQALRFECSLAHFNHYKEVYKKRFSDEVGC